jgi:phosphoribosylformylglycinamidine (FGAM) synthase-like enzyme
MGAEIDLGKWAALPLRALLFGEAQARVVVSTRRANKVLAVAGKYGVPAQQIGWVRDSKVLRIGVGSVVINAPVATLVDAYHEAIPRRMAKSAAPVEVAFTAATPA